MQEIERYHSVIHEECLVVSNVCSFACIALRLHTIENLIKILLAILSINSPHTTEEELGKLRLTLLMRESKLLAKRTVPIDLLIRIGTSVFFLNPKDNIFWKFGRIREEVVNRN